MLLSHRGSSSHFLSRTTKREGIAQEAPAISLLRESKIHSGQAKKFIIHNSGNGIDLSRLCSLKSAHFDLIENFEVSRAIENEMVYISNKHKSLMVLIENRRGDLM